MTGLAFFLQGRTFRHGVHPDENKEATCAAAIERMPFVDEYLLPLSQHIGAPSKPLVRAGQKVERGQVIAESAGFVSTHLHAPVTGTVKAIELRLAPSGKRVETVVITADAYATQKVTPLEVPDPAKADAEALISAIQRGGLVGLGGAAFPTHVKLKVPKGKRVQFVMLNGCECEPYLTCDHRVMSERAADVKRGLDLIMLVTGAERAYIGIERNKPDAIAALEKQVDAERVSVVGLQVKYPQGAEKMMIEAILKKEVPAGGLPLDLEIVVQNVGTAAALADLFDRGQPLIERAVTVTGPGVRRPANVMVPIGTPVKEVLSHCGGLLPEAKQVILGGPMMGNAQKSLDVPVTKGTSGILVLTRLAKTAPEEPCIRCGRCLEACPMFLNPSRLAQLSRAELTDELKEQHVLDCFECASCSFSCPSHIPLVQLIRVGKGLVRQKDAS
ncbi:MAG: electron transport complex subunit RsxC [Myxococcales bacterium]|nr:electron transport complex subunit RsxC [Myxococcales bacterium]